MYVTVLTPTLDEGPLLQQTVDAVFHYLQQHDVHILIITSARLTTQETRGVIEKLKVAYPGRIEAFDQTRPGVGCALREGFERAQGDAVTIVVADLATPPQALPKMVEKLEEGYDVVAATRWRHGIAFNGYHPVKLVFNFIFQQIFRVLYLTRLSDLTYGYRVYRTAVVKDIAWEEERHPFFFETILKPLRLGYNIAEVDVPWKSFTVRKASVGGAKFKDFIAYTRIGLRNRFLSKERMRR